MTTQNTTETNTSGRVAGIVRLALVGAAIYIAIFNPITQGVLGMAMANQERQAVSAKFGEERLFRTECPRYRDASLYERWTDWRVTNLGWCKNYIDRL